MSNYRKTLGKAGEDIACEYLKEKGHRILCRNFSCKFGEIDIISEELGYVIFTEVKTRRNEEFGPPSASVTREKITHILKSAQWFFKINGVENYDCRFDVVEVMFYDEAEGDFVCRHIKNAFDEGGM